MMAGIIHPQIESALAEGRIAVWPAVEEAFAEAVTSGADEVFVLGPIGAGKSTLAGLLALNLIYQGYYSATPTRAGEIADCGGLPDFAWIDGQRFAVVDKNDYYEAHDLDELPSLLICVSYRDIEELPSQRLGISRIVVELPPSDLSPRQVS